MVSKLWRYIDAVFRWLLGVETVLDATPVVEDIPDPNAPRILGMPYSHGWVCLCGAKLRIRSRQERAWGPSNYQPKMQPSVLSWEGLREERGWWAEDQWIVCPACQVGLSIEEYKQLRQEDRKIRGLLADHMALTPYSESKLQVAQDIREQLDALHTRFGVK